MLRIMKLTITRAPALIVAIATAQCISPTCRAQTITNGSLSVMVQRSDASFQVVSQREANRRVLNARPGAQIDGRWVRSNDYPEHDASVSTFSDALGSGHQIRLLCSGLAGTPDLAYTLQVYDQRPYATVQVEVQNHTGKVATVQDLRSIEAIGQPIIGIDGPESADRVLSDSYSEDWPRLVIYDLGSGPRQMHRAAWSQVIYNRESKQSLFVGALSADRFVTLMHLMYQGSGNDAKIRSYTVDSTGTTELQKENSLREDPSQDAIELSLALNDGQSLASERVMIATGSDYHDQLLAYGDAIRRLHDARVKTPNLIGWWSWTSYYMAINQGAALANAQWLADNLKSLGYKFFFIDEGYQYARGEYATPNARLFPEGVRTVSDEVRRLGLTFGLWVAPFEVSDRAWIYENHKEWLVHTADGTPIPIALSAHGDAIYALDATNPGAQEYMRQTYTTLTREWGVRFFKFDFMDTASIEGYRYRPNTTALEAQRIGLEFLRKVVGDNVLIDKDGSPMLPPVGLVDMGRISADTSHSFQNTKAVEPGIAARFYMNRNYFLDDPDAFNLCEEVPVANGARGQHDGESLPDAQAAIALAAVSGGMYEIGDDLSILGSEKDRLDLVKDQDLLDMAKISRAATPVDLLSYDAEDGQPSIFFLREDPRQSMLVVFNWTEQPRSHSLNLADLGLPADHKYRGTDVLNASGVVTLHNGTLKLDDMPRHSVRVIKLIEPNVPPAAPTITAQIPSRAKAGEIVAFSARAQESGVPALSYHWDFGDGSSTDGPQATHAYTRDADFTVQLAAEGLDGLTSYQTFTIEVTGTQEQGDIRQNTRYTEP
jgi:alpha-galactosidase